MRVRFEVRDLPPGQWERVVRALWIMKLTPGDVGRRDYGDAFVSYDEMVVKHMKAALNKPGDQAHFTPAFPVYHRLWLLEVENSLITIDAAISGLPYWNSFKDGFAVFNNDYFGSAPTAENDYTVVDGKFSYWRVPTVDDNPDDHDTISNVYGYARAPLSPNRSPVITRRMRSLCGVDFGLGEPAAWDFCAGRGPDFWEYQLCIDGSIHGRAHMTVGGSWKRPSQFDNPGDDPGLCAQWYGLITNTVTPSDGFTRKQLGSFINAYVADSSCFDCSCCTLDKPPDECLCRRSTEAANNGCGPLWMKLKELQDPPYQDYRAHLTHRNNLEIIGDFLDPTASANDPVFLFHHANVDRNWQKWLDLHLLRADGTYRDLDSVDYLKYPRSGLVYGNNLDDPFGGGANFQFSGLFGETKEDADAYTVKEALQKSHNQTVYIYDSLDLHYAPDTSIHDLTPGMQYYAPSPVSRTVSDTTSAPQKEQHQQKGQGGAMASGILVGDLVVSPMLFTFLLSGVLSVVALLVSYLIKRRVA